MLASNTSNDDEDGNDGDPGVLLKDGEDAISTEGNLEPGTNTNTRQEDE